VNPLNPTWVANLKCNSPKHPDRYIAEKEVWEVIYGRRRYRIDTSNCWYCQENQANDAEKGVFDLQLPDLFYRV
jgi:hypothetical protein